MANIKEKVLNFGQSIGLSKAEMARQLGISKSNFVGDVMSSELNGSVVIKFCQLYPEVSAEWLLRDEGPMRRDGDVVAGDKNINSGTNYGHIGTTHGVEELPFPGRSSECDPDSCAWIKAKDDVIRAKDDVIEAQRITIEALRGAQK